jgi:hypothetical protein
LRITEDRTVAAAHRVTPASWQTGLEELLGRVARRFGRVGPRRHARASVLGLLADLPRKNCWTIAEHTGRATPDGLQHLLAGGGLGPRRGPRLPQADQSHGSGQPDRLVEVLTRTSRHENL